MLNRYYQKHKEKLWKDVRERYQNISKEEKEKIRKKSQDRYQNLSEEEKEKKRQYYWERNKDLSEEEKENKVEYMKNYYLAQKNIFLVDLWIFRDLGQSKNSKQIFKNFSGFPRHFID